MLRADAAGASAGAARPRAPQKCCAACSWLLEQSERAGAAVDVVQFLRLDHHNANPELVGKKLPVCRAIATTKMQYLPGIRSWLRQEAGVTDPLEGNRFHLAYPDLSPASGGTRALADSSWQVLRAEMKNVRDTADYVKHILNLHEGEAKLIEDWGWQEFDPDYVGGISQECFWQVQFCRTQRARSLLRRRPEAAANLVDEDIDLIMDAEKNELTMLRCEPRAGERPSSGGTRWFIRTGKIVTLAQVFAAGKKPCTCFDLYGYYNLFPTIIFKRKHSRSQAPHGAKRANAKNLQHMETGRYGLPSRNAHPKRRPGGGR